MPEVAMSSTLPIATNETATTMAGLIQSILADPGLTEVRRRNVASSIRRFCAALNVPPEQAPAAFWFFRERLERFHPAQTAIKVRRWQTIRSDVAFALKRIGVAPDQPKPRARFSSAWKELRERMRAAGISWGLSRLATFCDARSIPPSAIDDAVIAAYHNFVRTQTFRTKPHRHHRAVCLLWNRVAGIAADMQIRPVTVPSYRKTYSPSWETLPAAFRTEAEAWLKSLSEEGDLLSETGPLRPLRPASIQSYRYALRQAVAGLRRSGRPLESIDSLRVLIAPDAAKAALQFHLDRNNNKRSQMTAQIAHVLVKVAEHVVGDDETVLTILKRYRRSLSPPRSGLKPRPRQALRQFADRANIEKLLMLPDRIHQRLRRKTEYTKADARLMQVAVALELLLMRPIRRGNLVGLRLGEHVFKMGDKTVVVIDGAEVKNGVDHDYPIPTESARLLGFYVQCLLPVFGDNPMGFLFPGEIPGRPKSAEQFGRFFRQTIHEKTGLKVYPHLLRHFGATLYLTEYPEGLEVVRRVLGHRSADTTHRSYAGIHDEIAVRRFDQLVLGIRNAILTEIGDG
jgi:integrase